jgi:ATP-dependent Clp protease ATP-binding subunit ClpB
MNFENYTERSRGFIQNAQTLASRSGHQQLTPEHLLKVILDDKEGMAAGLIKNAGGDPTIALKGAEVALEKLPSVEGSGAGQVYPARELVRFFEQAEEEAAKASDSFVTA